MGLSVVHGVVIDHHGTIKVNSILNQGSQFKMMLPLVEQGSYIEEPLQSENKRRLCKNTTELNMLGEDS